MLNNHLRDRDQVVSKAKIDLIILVSQATPIRYQIQLILTILTTSLALTMKLLLQHHLTLFKHIINRHHLHLEILLNQADLDDLLITGPNLYLSDHNFLQGRPHLKSVQVDLGIDLQIMLKDLRPLVIIQENRLLYQIVRHHINKDQIRYPKGIPQTRSGLMLLLQENRLILKDLISQMYHHQHHKDILDP